MKVYFLLAAFLRAQELFNLEDDVNVIHVEQNQTQIGNSTEIANKSVIAKVTTETKVMKNKPILMRDFKNPLLKTKSLNSFFGPPKNKL
jgi:hypothetical protein